MSSDSENADLVALVQDAREHLIFFKELGVEGLEKKSSGTAAKTAPESQRVTPQLEPVVAAPKETRVTTQAVTPAADSLFGDLSATPARIPRSSETFEEIWADIGDCTRCPLYQGRKNIVHTDGNRKARLMFVGEAPGADEDIQAKPFVGRAGQLLTKIIEAIGLKREEVLIGNVNRCRPPANRPPTPEEATMCKPFLLREIAAVQPEVIVVLGNTAMRNLLELKQGITKVRGQFQDYQGVKVMPTFHPAYLLRDPSKKKETWEDLKMVRDYLDSTRKQES
jgi:uracil-DNA glycosylase family 4